MIKYIIRDERGIILTAIYWILIIAFFILSLIGVFVPMIPDIIPVWVSVLIYQFGPFSNNLPTIFWIILSLVTIITLLADFLANMIAVKQSGGSNLALISALIGLAVGIVIMGPFGIIIGPFIAIFLAEYYRSQKKEFNKPLKIAFSTVFAFLGSGLVKFVLILSVIIWFLIIVL